MKSLEAPAAPALLNRGDCGQQQDSADKQVAHIGGRSVAQCQPKQTHSRQAPTGSKKRKYTSFSQRQTDILETYFSRGKSIVCHNRINICLETGLSEKVVKSWFINRRAKKKRIDNQPEKEIGTLRPLSSITGQAPLSMQYSCSTQQMQPASGEGTSWMAHNPHPHCAQPFDYVPPPQFYGQPFEHDAYSQPHELPLESAPDYMGFFQPQGVASAYRTEPPPYDHQHIYERK